MGWAVGDPSQDTRLRYGMYPRGRSARRLVWMYVCTLAGGADGPPGVEQSSETRVKKEILFARPSNPFPSRP